MINRKEGRGPVQGQVLGQGAKLPQSPFKMALGGFVAVAAVGYVVLYSHKKPEASAVDVANVATGETQIKK